LAGTILRSNLHESKQLVLLPDVHKAIEQENLIIWPWVSDIVTSNPDNSSSILTLSQ
jgi:hypothetical protein